MYWSTIGWPFVVKIVTGVPLSWDSSIAISVSFATYMQAEKRLMV